MYDEGFILAYRSTWKSPHFDDEPFSQREAWLWMIAEACWAPTTTRINGKMVTLERGQFTHSVRFLAEKWKWSKSKVSRFLKRLKNETVIGTDGGTGQIVVTICNYDTYQTMERAGGTPNGTGRGTAAGQQRDSSGTEKKETKPVNEVKKEDRDTNVSLVPSVPDENRSRKKYPDEFESFWKVYPKRPTDTKALAFKAWMKARKSVDEFTLRAAATVYSRFCGSTGHESQLVQTWVNREGWTADYSSGQARASPARKPEKRSALMQTLYDTMGD